MKPRGSAEPQGDDEPYECGQAQFFFFGWSQSFLAAGRKDVLSHNERHIHRTRLRPSGYRHHKRHTHPSLLYPFDGARHVSV